MSLRHLCYLMVEKNEINKERRYWHAVYRRSNSPIAFSVRENRKTQGKELMKKIKVLKKSLGLKCWWDGSGNIIAISTITNEHSYFVENAKTYFIKEHIRVMADEYALEKLLIEGESA